MSAILLLAAISSAQSPLNPRAIEFVQRDPVVKQWALTRFDRNRDGWLTLFEAQEAVEQFREIADEDRDGRISVREFDGGVAFLKARYDLSLASFLAPSPSTIWLARS